MVLVVCLILLKILRWLPVETQTTGKGEYCIFNKNLYLHTTNLFNLSHLKMKTLLLLALCSVVALYSCTKNLNDPKRITYAMSATIDGKYETFTSGDSVRAIGTNGVYITGVNDTTSDRISMYLGDTQNGFGPGVYTTDTASGNIRSSQMLFFPASDNTHYYYSYYIKDTYNFMSTVTITSVDSTELKGTFSGNIVLVDYISHTAALKNKVITNGQFNINRKK